MQAHHVRVRVRAQAGGGTVTTTTTATVAATNYTYKKVEVVPGAPDAVFDFYAGSWVGEEIHAKPSVWAVILAAPDTGSGTWSLEEMPTPAGAPAGRTRKVKHSSGAFLTETMYSSDAATRVCKYALLGPLAHGSPQGDFMTAMCGLQYDAFDETFTTVPSGEGTQVTWEVSANVGDTAKADQMLNMFYDLFTQIFTGTFS